MLSLWGPLVEKLSKRCACLRRVGERPELEVPGLDWLPVSRGLPLVLFTCFTQRRSWIHIQLCLPQERFSLCLYKLFGQLHVISSLQLATLYPVEFLSVLPGYSCICYILCYILTLSKNVKRKKTWKISLRPLSYLIDLCMGMGMGQKLRKDCLKGQIPLGKEAQDGRKN